VNHVMRRRKLNLVSKAGFIFVLLSVRTLSASGPSGIRRKTWRDLIVGFCGERENLKGKDLMLVEFANVRRSGAGQE